VSARLLMLPVVYGAGITPKGRLPRLRPLRERLWRGLRPLVWAKGSIQQATLVSTPGEN
jgi:hypothetical protein